MSQENIWILPVLNFYVVFLKSQNISTTYLRETKILFLLLLLLLLLSLLLSLLLTDDLTHCFNGEFLHLRLSNNKLWAQESLGGFEQCVGGHFSATQLSEFQYLFPLTILLTLCVLFLARLSLVIRHWLCSISFSTIVPNLDSFLLFLIL